MLSNACSDGLIIKCSVCPIRVSQSNKWTNAHCLANTIKAIAFQGNYGSQEALVISAVHKSSERLVKAAEDCNKYVNVQASITIEDMRSQQEEFILEVKRGLQPLLLGVIAQAECIHFRVRPSRECLLIV